MLGNELNMELLLGNQYFRWKIEDELRECLERKKQVLGHIRWEDDNEGKKKCPPKRA